MTGDMLQDTKDILLVTSYIVIGDIQLNVEISIWMQSRFDGFDFSATLVLVIMLMTIEQVVRARVVGDLPVALGIIEMVRQVKKVLY